jgi:hypothetical protein
MSTGISKKDQGRFLKRALLAADWYEYSQLGKERTEWDADRGRFMYYYFLPDGRYVPGISWTQARAIFVLADAYTATGKKKYLDSAIMGGRYLEALQVLDPHHQRLHGCFMYRTPQGPEGGSLDGAQSVSALMMLEGLTGNREYLRRSQAFAAYLLRNYRREKTFLFKGRIFPRHEVVRIDTAPQWDTVEQASAICLWHLFRRTGDRTLLPLLRKAADQILLNQRADGALQMTQDIAKIPATAMKYHNHHWGHGRGADKFVLRNDDGLTVVLLAAHRIFGKEKYLDAAVAYADWIVRSGPTGPRPYCSFPCQAGNVLDIGRAADRSYRSWILDNLEKYLLELQNLDRTDRRGYGGFRGEDEHTRGGKGGIFGGHSLDYVTNRTTCYAAGTLFRLSGQGTGSGFSVDGLKV